MLDYRMLLERQDENFLSFARTLNDKDWVAPSMCRGWTNKDVLAHLALGLHISNTRMALGITRYRSFDTANDILSRRYADRHSATELISDFDRARRRPRGVGRALPTPLMLGDHTVHHLDIALALGKSAGLDVYVANAVLHVETTIPNPFVPAKTRSKGLRLATVDTGWVHGSADHPKVEGSAEALISTLAGRKGADNRLAGPGAAALLLRMKH